MKKMIMELMARPMAEMYQRSVPTPTKTLSNIEVLEVLKKGKMSGSRAFDINTSSQSDWDFFYTNKECFEEAVGTLKKFASKIGIVQWGYYQYQTEDINAFYIGGHWYQLSLVDKLMSEKEAFIASFIKRYRKKGNLSVPSGKWENLSMDLIKEIIDLEKELLEMKRNLLTRSPIKGVTYEDNKWFKIGKCTRDINSTISRSDYTTWQLLASVINIDINVEKGIDNNDIPI